MMDTFKVVLDYNNQDGYAEYNSKDKSITVKLQDETKRAEIEKFLRKEQVMMIPQNTMTDFKEVCINPITNVDNFKLALTRLWEHTNVLVQWSRPA